MEQFSAVLAKALSGSIESMRFSMRNAIDLTVSISQPILMGGENE